MPAGPAPTTTTSGILGGLHFAGCRLRPTAARRRAPPGGATNRPPNADRGRTADFVPLLEQGQAGADGFVAVQVDEAVKARADPAEEPPPLAARSRRPPCPLAVGQQSSGDRCCRVERRVLDRRNGSAAAAGELIVGEERPVAPGAKCREQPSLEPVLRS